MALVHCEFLETRQCDLPLYALIIHFAIGCELFCSAIKAKRKISSLRSIGKISLILRLVFAMWPGNQWIGFVAILFPLFEFDDLIHSAKLVKR